MEKIGADVVIRPVRAYQELLVRSLVANGTEKELENLSINEGDHMIRLNFFFNRMFPIAGNGKTNITI